jgi:rod shape-determining protein MreC
VIRLSAPARQAFTKLIVPVLLIISLGLMITGRVQSGLIDHIRMQTADRIAPIGGDLVQPWWWSRSILSSIGNLWAQQRALRKLRQENEQLRQWQAVALALSAENETLKANLGWTPDPPASFITARVADDAGGVYARSILIATGPGSPVRRGQIALDARGLVGRVTETGAQSARVLLLTDMNSRVPVLLEQSHSRAILAGGNTETLHLIFWPEGTNPVEGERVVTSAEANAFPAGLPVGTVHWSGKQAEVHPFANFSNLQMVRVFNYGLHGLLPPEAETGHVVDPAAARR